MTVLTCRSESDVKTVQEPAAKPTAGLRAMLVALFGVLLATRLLGLMHHSLSFDEGYTFNLDSTTSFAQFRALFASYTVSEHVQPLYNLCMFAWTRVAGTSDIALRLPSAFCSILSGIVVYRIAVGAAGKGSAVPAFSLFVFSVSSYSVYYAQDARPYAMLQLLAFTLLALWLRDCQASTDRPRRITSTVLLSGIAVLCAVGSPFTALLVVSLAFADVLRLKTFRRWVAVWGLPGVSVILVLGGCLAVARQHGLLRDTQDFVSRKQPLWMNVPYMVQGLMFGTTLPPGSQSLHGPGKLHALVSAAPVLLLCGLALAASVLAATQMATRALSASTARQTLALAAVVYTVLLFLGFGWIGHLNLLPRHGSALYAVCAVLAILWSTSGQTRRTSRWLAPAVGCVVLCNLISLWGYFVNPEFMKDDYRGAAAVVRQDNACCTFLVEGQNSLLRHYGASSIDASSIEVADLSHFLQVNAGAQPVRLVINRYRGFRWDRSVSPADLLRSTYVCEQDTRLSYIEIDACQPRPSTIAALAAPLEARGRTDAR